MSDKKTEILNRIQKVKKLLKDAEIEFGKMKTIDERLKSYEDMEAFLITGDGKDASEKDLDYGLECIKNLENKTKNDIEELRVLEKAKKTWKWDLTIPNGGQYMRPQDSKSVKNTKSNSKTKVPSPKNKKEDSNGGIILISIILVVLISIFVFDYYEQNKPYTPSKTIQETHDIDDEISRRYSIPEEPPYEGIQKEYWRDGTLSSVNHYEDGYKTHVDMYDRNGNMVARSYYRHGEYIKTVEFINQTW